MARTNWWSKEPDLNKTEHKRFRRFVARQTAIGTRDQGGLGNMNWSSHVKAFQAQWILRYAADPATSSWKNLLDSLLLEDGEGRIKFTEGRSIFFCPLKFNHRLKLLADLPKKAHYIRACIKSFWSLNITQDLLRKPSANDAPYPRLRAIWAVGSAINGARLARPP